MAAAAVPARPAAPLEQGQGLRFAGLAEVSPPPAAPAFKGSLAAFWQSRHDLMLWTYAPLFCDSACKLGPYLARQGLLSTLCVMLLNTFHAHGHAPQCASLFGAVFVRLLGAQDGECCERFFARMALLARVTRVMNPPRRSAAMALDMLFFNSDRSLEHAEFLKQQCILAERRVYHADVKYAGALSNAARRTGIDANVLHSRVLEFSLDLLHRARAIEDVSKGKAATTLSVEEKLRVEHGKLEVEKLYLQERLALLLQRDELFVDSEVKRIALAEYERDNAPTVPRTISGMKARLAVVRAESLRVTRGMKSRDIIVDAATATIAYNTARFSLSVANVMDLLQRLNLGYVVRRGGSQPLLSVLPAAHTCTLRPPFLCSASRVTPPRRSGGRL